MSIGTVICSILIFLVIADLILCGIYARFRKMYDQKGTEKKEMVSVHDISSDEKRGLRRLLRKIDNFIYGLCRYTSIWVGHIPGHTMRRVIFKYIFCMQINRHAIIHGGCEIRSPWNIKIGNSVIGVGAILDGRNGIEIEDDVVMATGVWIWTEQHDLQDSYFRCLDKGGKVTIKRHVWIGNRVSILPRLTIGEGCVIAAGAVVTKSCEPFYMYGLITA